jgi:SrtB family sortase
MVKPILFVYNLRKAYIELTLTPSLKELTSMPSAPKPPAEGPRPKDELWAFIDQTHNEALWAEAKAQKDADFEPPLWKDPPPPPAAKKPKKLGDWFWRVGFYLSVAMVVVSTGLLVLDAYRSHRDQKIYEELLKLQASFEAPSSEPGSTPNEPGQPTILPGLAAAYDENNDLVGWIKVPDTVVDFPVVQGVDNDEYLRANFRRQYSLHGIPFVDYRIDLSGQPEHQPDNIIVYGHNIGDGLMFNMFVNYSDPAYYEKHPIIELSSLYDTRSYKIFAAFITNGDTKNGYLFPYHMYLSFAAADQFDGFIAAIRDRSYLNVDMDVRYGDRLLCISTCTYEFDGARFVVFARELREGESTDPAPVTRNPDPLLPAAFTRLYGGRSDQPPS